MKSLPPHPTRKPIRLSDYDYSQNGGYFVTICTQDRRCMFGRIENGKMRLNEAGRMVEYWWNKLPEKFLGVLTDYHVVMPNHFHGILIIVGAIPCGRPPRTATEKDSITKPRATSVGRPHGIAPTLSAMIHWFKTMTTNHYIRSVKTHGWPAFHGKLWQRNYYEHIIRNDYTLSKIRTYIHYNPLKWELDRENPNRIGTDEFDKWLEGHHENVVSPLKP